MIGYGLVTLGGHAVGLVTHLDHLLHLGLDGCYVLTYLFYIVHVDSRDRVGLVAREQLLDLVHVVKQRGLVAHGSGDDVVDGQVTQYAAFDLNLLGVCLPLHLVAGAQVG